MKNKNTLLLIVSMGHSGSTIMDKYLGSYNREIFSTGELVNLKKTIEENNYCSCGTLLKKCTTWKKILNEIEMKGHRIKGNEKELDYLEDLYLSIIKFSGANIVVDSSKGLVRTYLINRRMKKRFRICILHLVRDPRGVLTSYQKKTWKLPIKVGSHPRTGERNTYRFSTTNDVAAILKWITKNILISCLAVLFFKKNNRLMVNFDDFTSHPEEYHSLISARLKMKESPLRAVIIGERESHIVNGNASRFYEGKIFSVKHKWRDKITKKDLCWINILTYIQRCIYGFK